MLAMRHDWQGGTGGWGLAVPLSLKERWGYDPQGLVGPLELLDRQGDLILGGVGRRRRRRGGGVESTHRCQSHPFRFITFVPECVAAHGMINMILYRKNVGGDVINLVLIHEQKSTHRTPISQ